MKNDSTVLSTGMPGLDHVLQGLRLGDNVVWEVDGIEDYLPMIGPLCSEASRLQRKLVYFRFARHNALLDDTSGAEVYQLDPGAGFERFLTEILDVIERSGRGAYYIFDNLSDLAADWFSDRMLGNFFCITCPYLYEMDTIAYFALLKNHHSFHATQPIFTTAQVIIEVYRQQNRIFIHPMKVWQRYSQTMYTLHSWEGDVFKPVTNSATITDILAEVPKPWLEFTIHRPGVWGQTFQRAQQTLTALRTGHHPEHDPAELTRLLIRMVISHDERLQKLAEKYFDLKDLGGIMQRMVGTGSVGGKTVGMLLSRAILKKSSLKWTEILESHDSFYVGSDVFYTYLVQNGCWWLRRRQRDFNLYLKRMEEARLKILNGVFPEYIQQQFMEMLEYFGQSPLIVRSSSLLEDSYGKAFSGKYDSVFLANQGTPQERLQAFMRAVRTVYASAMSADAITYRLHHGLLDRDEQMALLVQRVSGELHGDYFFPQTAGVGYSFNPFVWNENIDPNAGVLRLVFGLGTRAVDRSDDDYTRLVALNAPLKRPEARPDEIREFAQRRVDVLDLKSNQLTHRDFEQIIQSFPKDMVEMFAMRDENRPVTSYDRDAQNVFYGFLNFDRMLTETQFVQTMRDMCHTLQQAYQYPVDIEYTTNFSNDGTFRINLLQCRPFQVKICGESSRIVPPEKLEGEKVFLQTAGPIVGHGTATSIDRLIYVIPSIYSQLSTSQRYSVARAIGQLTHLEPYSQRKTIMLVGPGRWGTSMPSLGVPVSFAEINTVSIICELALMHEGLIPDVSLGTHFFNDLVEMDILYMAVSPHSKGHILNEQYVLKRPNHMKELLPSVTAAYAEAIRVIDFSRIDQDEALYLNVDSMKQQGVCYTDTKW